MKHFTACCHPCKDCGAYVSFGEEAEHKERCKGSTLADQVELEDQAEVHAANSRYLGVKFVSATTSTRPGAFGLLLAGRLLEDEEFAALMRRLEDSKG